MFSLKQLAVILTFFLIFPYPGRAEESVLTLETCVQKALDHHLSIQLKRLDRDIADKTLEREQGKYGLKLSGTLSATQSRSPSSSQLAGADVVSQGTFLGRVGIGQDLVSGGKYELLWENNVSQSNSSFVTPGLNPAFNPDLRLTFTQPLLRNFYIPHQQLKRLTLQRQMTQYQLEQQILDIILQVKEAYWKALMARENLKVTEELLQMDHSLYEIILSQLKAGKVPDLEQLRSESEILKRQQDIFSATLDVKNADDRLLQLITNRSDDPLLIPDRLPLTSPTQHLDRLPAMDDMMKEALSLRPDFLALSQQIQQQQLEIVIAKNGLYPLLSFQSSLALTGLAGNYVDSLGRMLTGGNLSLNAELSFLFPVFNQEAKANVEEQEKKLEQALLQQQMLSQRILFDLRDVQHQFQNASVQLVSLGQARETARARVSVEIDKYQNGKSTLLEVIAAQQTLQQIESGYIQTYTNLKIQETRYYHLIGKM